MRLNALGTLEKCKSLKRTFDKFGMGETAEKWSGKAAKDRKVARCVSKFPFRLDKQTVRHRWCTLDDLYTEVRAELRMLDEAKHTLLYFKTR